MTNPPIRRSRAQYSSRACDECRRRKVKCSGTEPCQCCLDSQTTCQFTHDGQRGRKRALESQNHQRVYRNVRAPQTGGNIQDNHISTLEDDLSHIQDRTTSVNVPEQNMQQQTPQSLPCLDSSQNPQNISGCPNCGNVSDSASPSTIDTENWFGHGSALLGTQKRVLETLSTDNSPNNNTNLSNTKESTTAQGQETDKIIIHACALSNNPRLAPLIRLFLTDYNNCFYCLDPDPFVGRLSSLLENHSSPHGQLRVPSNKPELISLAALACMVLAFAETLVHEASIAPQDTTTCNFSHQMWYTEARRMLELYPKSTPTNMDIVQFHMVATYYAAFLDCISQEPGNSTYHAIVMTITSAYSIGLNNEARWSHLSPEERIARKCLWASIDLMDKQIAYKCGWPYLIQESEVLVSDLTKDIKALDESYKCFAINDRKEKDETASGRPNHTSSSVHPSASTALSMPILLKLQYVQSLIEITRAFKRAWRSFFSVRRPADWDRDDVEEIDALLRRIQRNLPSELTWNSVQFSQSSKTWEAMTLHRIRLLLLTRISILRLAIRHASVRGRKGDPQLADRYTAVEIDYTTTVCEEIACTTIAALFKYLDRCSPGSCLTTYAASSVLECIYHTVAISQLGLDGGMLKTCQLSDRMIATLAEGVEIFRRTASYTVSQRTNLPKSIVPIIEGIVAQKRHSNRTSTGGNESRSLSSPPSVLPSLKDQLSSSQVSCVFPAPDTMPQEGHSSSRDRSIDVDSSYLFDPSLLPAPFLENGRAFDIMNTGFFPSSFEMDFERSLQ